MVRPNLTNRYEWSYLCRASLHASLFRQLVRAPRFSVCRARTACSPEAAAAADFLDLPDARGGRRQRTRQVSDLQNDARAGEARPGVELSNPRRCHGACPRHVQNLPARARTRGQGPVVHVQAAFESQRARARPMSNMQAAAGGEVLAPA